MTIPNSSSDGLILLAHGTPNVLGEMDTYMKFVTGGRAVPPELVHELQERYAQIGLGDEPSAEGPPFQETAGRLDLTLIRAESLNASPLLIDALEDLALHGGRPKYALAGWHRLRKRWSSMFHPPSSSHASQSHRASELSARTWCYEHSSHRN